MSVPETFFDKEIYTKSSMFPNIVGEPIKPTLPTDTLLSIFANMTPFEIAQKRRVSRAWRALLCPENIQKILIMQFHKTTLTIKECLKDSPYGEQKLAINLFLSTLKFDTSNLTTFKDSLHNNRESLASLLVSLPPESLLQISKLILPPGYENTIIKVSCWIRREPNYRISNPDYLKKYLEWTGSVLSAEGGNFIPVSMAASNGWNSNTQPSPRKLVPYDTKSSIPTYLFEDKLQNLKTGDMFTLKLLGGCILVATCINDPDSGADFKDVIAIKVDELPKQWARDDLTSSFNRNLRISAPTS